MNIGGIARPLPRRSPGPDDLRDPRPSQTPGVGSPYHHNSERSRRHHSDRLSPITRSDQCSGSDGPTWHRLPDDAATTHCGATPVRSRERLGPPRPQRQMTMNVISIGPLPGRCPLARAILSSQTRSSQSTGHLPPSRPLHPRPTHGFGSDWLPGGCRTSGRACAQPFLRRGLGQHASQVLRQPVHGTMGDLLADPLKAPLHLIGR